MLDTAGGSTSVPDGEAAIPASPSPTIVHIAERCPGAPHAYDTVWLRPTASLPMGIAVSAVLRDAIGDQPVVEAGLALEFLRFGISGWTFEDASGPVRFGEPIARDVLEHWLPFGNGGLEVVEAASALYGDAVLAPFLARFTKSSKAGPTEPLTSVRTASGGTHRKRSKRSLPNGTGGKLSAVPAP